MMLQGLNVADVQRPSIFLIDDLPSNEDLCGFQPIALQLQGLIHEWAKSTPFPYRSSLVVGINGQWGSGKTTLANQVKSLVNRRSPDPTKERPLYYRWLDISTWKYANRDSFLRALMCKLLDEIQASLKSLCLEHVPSPPAIHNAQKIELGSLIAQMRTSLYQATEEKFEGVVRINWSSVFSVLFQEGSPIYALFDGLRSMTGLLDENVVDASPRPASEKKFQGPECQTLRFEELRSSEQFEQAFEVLVKILCGLPSAPQNNRSLDGRLILCIDDLDRCMPENSVEILESLKIFLDNPLCCYIVPVDPLIVEAGLAARYASSSHTGAWFPDYRDYLDKIFNARFQLDALSPAQVASLLPDFFALMVNQGSHFPDGALCAAARSLAVVCPNPRRIKIVLRQLNSLIPQATEETLAREIYSIGFDLECGRKYPFLSHFPDKLQYLSEVITGAIPYDEKATEVLAPMGVDRSCLTTMRCDLRFRELLRRLGHYEAFSELQQALTSRKTLRQTDHNQCYL